MYIGGIDQQCIHAYSEGCVRDGGGTREHKPNFSSAALCTVPLNVDRVLLAQAGHVIFTLDPFFDCAGVDRLRASIYSPSTGQVMEMRRRESSTKRWVKRTTVFEWSDDDCLLLGETYLVRLHFDFPNDLRLVRETERFRRPSPRDPDSAVIRCQKFEHHYPADHYRSYRTENGSELSSEDVPARNFNLTILKLQEDGVFRLANYYCYDSLALEIAAHRKREIVGHWEGNQIFPPNSRPIFHSENVHSFPFLSGHVGRDIFSYFVKFVSRRNFTISQRGIRSPYCILRLVCQAYRNAIPYGRTLPPQARLTNISLSESLQIKDVKMRK
jgi:hypothetical protein